MVENGTTACAWDTVIPFAPLWEAYKRVIKPGGAIVLFGSQPFTSALVMSNPKWFCYEWIWHKPQGTGHLNAKKMPLKSHESILVFGPSLPTYRPVMSKGKPYAAFEGRRDTAQVYGKQSSLHAKNNGTRYPKTVLPFAQQREARHPTQKPVALFEYLIRTYTEPGEVVLDNCFGSGTAAVACIQSGRRFIGIEKDADYFAAAEQRIRDTHRNLFAQEAYDAESIDALAA